MLVTLLLSYKAIHYFKSKTPDVCQKKEKPRHLLRGGPGKKIGHFCTYMLFCIGLEKQLANEI